MREYVLLQDLVMCDNNIVNFEQSIKYTHYGGGINRLTYAIDSVPFFGNTIYAGPMTQAYNFLNHPPIIMTRNIKYLSKVFYNCNKPFIQYKNRVDSINKCISTKKIAITSHTTVLIPRELIIIVTNYLYKPKCLPKWTEYVSKYYCLSFFIFTDHKQKDNLYLKKAGHHDFEDTEYRGAVTCGLCAISKLGAPMDDLLMYTIWEALVHIVCDTHVKNMIKSPIYDMKLHKESLNKLKVSLINNSFEKPKNAS